MYMYMYMCMYMSMHVQVRKQLYVMRGLIASSHVRQKYEWASGPSPSVPVESVAPCGGLSAEKSDGLIQQ